MSPVSTRRKVVNAVAWVVVICGLVTVGWQLARNFDADAAAEAKAAQQRAEDAERIANEMCESTAVVNQRLTDFLAVAGAPRTPPPDATPSQLEGYRVTNAEREQLRDIGAAMFDPAVCADGEPPQSAIETTTTSGTTIP